MKLTLEYLCIQRLCHRISLLLGLYFHFYLFLGSNFCDKLGLNWILVTPKQNFHIQDFLDKTRSNHKRSFFPHSEGSLHGRCWEMSLYLSPVCSNLQKIFRSQYRLLFLRSISYFFTKIYMNCFVSS